MKRLVQNIQLAAFLKVGLSVLQSLEDQTTTPRISFIYRYVFKISYFMYLKCRCQSLGIQERARDHLLVAQCCVLLAGGVEK